LFFSFLYYSSILTYFRSFFSVVTLPIGLLLLRVVSVLEGIMTKSKKNEKLNPSDKYLFSRYFATASKVLFFSQAASFFKLFHCYEVSFDHASIEYLFSLSSFYLFFVKQFRSVANVGGSTFLWKIDGSISCSSGFIPNVSTVQVVLAPVSALFTCHVFYFLSSSVSFWKVSYLSRYPFRNFLYLANDLSSLNLIIRII
jgi:hypothetical protein